MLKMGNDVTEIMSYYLNNSNNTSLVVTINGLL